jgi:glycosyltransferase involved in cell wall biosynthesis
MTKQKPNILFLLNILNPGTGPFQRAIRLDDQQMDVTILSCTDSNEEVISKAEKLVTDFGRRRVLGLGGGNKLQLAIKLCRFIKRCDPDIIQTNHTFSSMVAILYSCIIRKPLVVNFEGTLFKSSGIFRRTGLKLLYSLCDATICVSNAVNESNQFCEKTLRKHIVRRTIYNGVDHQQIESTPTGSGFKKRHGIPEENLVFGFVGDLKPVKDIPTIIKAFAEASLDNATLLIVGGGSLHDDLASLATSLGISDQVVFTGMIERREVYCALKEMDVFVMASLIEGLSEAIAQAMSAGLPVITSDIPPNAELIINEENGLLFPVGQPKNLAAQLRNLYNDPAKRALFGKNNHKIALERLDIFNIVDEYSKLYCELLQTKRNWEK